MEVVTIVAKSEHLLLDQENPNHVENDWNIYPHFILRSTGFPIEWMKDLCFMATEEQMKILFELEQGIQKSITLLREAQMKEDFPVKLSLLWKKVRKKITEKKQIPIHSFEELATGGLSAEFKRLLKEYQEQVTSYQQHREEAEITFQNELRDKQKKLQAIFQQSKFQEAVFQQSPSMYSNTLTTYLNSPINKRNSYLKRIERQLISYLQRFCTKNETTSFFGPIQYGELTDEEPAIQYQSLPTERERKAFLPFWAVKAMAEVISNIPALYPHLAVRLSNQIVILDEGIYIPKTDQKIRLPHP